MKTCKISGCARKHKAKGLCDACYRQAKRLENIEGYRARKRSLYVGRPAAKKEPTLHDKLIERACVANELEKFNFTRTCLAHIAAESLGKVEDWDCWEMIEAGARFKPDAYKIDRDSMTICVWEVSVTNSPEKSQAKWSDLAFELDIEPWHIQVVHVNAQGICYTKLTDWNEEGKHTDRQVCWQVDEKAPFDLCPKANWTTRQKVSPEQFQGILSGPNEYVRAHFRSLEARYEIVKHHTDECSCDLCSCEPVTSNFCPDFGNSWNNTPYVCMGKITFERVMI